MPATAPDPEVTTYNLDNPSQPGSFGGVPLFFAKSCPAGPPPIGSGSCEVDTLHSPPSDQRWVEYRSTNDFLSSPDDATARVGFRVTFPPASCTQFGGHPVALWYSDDSDDRYGRTVIDAFVDNITMTDAPRGGNGSAINFLRLVANPWLTGSAAIDFGVATAERVKIQVFDASGRWVRTLADRGFVAGTHRLTWDGADASGRMSARGVYFVRSQHTDSKFVAQSKLVILK